MLLILFLVPLLLGGARGRLLHTAGNPKAGSDGSQYDCYGLNDEFPSILFHNFEL